jgi:hypothetical protein
MQRWELWQHADGTLTYFRSDKEQQRKKAEEAGGALVWETEVPGFTEAMRAWYGVQGFELYEPMLREDGTPYPEDEADELRERMKSDVSTFYLRCPTTDQLIQMNMARGNLDWLCPACLQAHALRYRKTLASPISGHTTAPPETPARIVDPQAVRELFHSRQVTLTCPTTRQPVVLDLASLLPDDQGTCEFDCPACGTHHEGKAAIAIAGLSLEDPSADPDNGLD